MLLSMRQVGATAPGGGVAACDTEGLADVWDVYKVARVDTFAVRLPLQGCTVHMHCHWHGLCFLEAMLVHSTWPPLLDSVAVRPGACVFQA